MTTTDNTYPNITTIDVNPILHKSMVYIAFEVRHKLLSLSGSDARPKEFAPFLMTLYFLKK